jgi:transposase-like protein
MPATLKPIDDLVRERRKQLAREAARVYAETRSLRKTAERLGISHESVRALIKESERDSP